VNECLFFDVFNFTGVTTIKVGLIVESVSSHKLTQLNAVYMCLNNKNTGK